MNNVLLDPLPKEWNGIHIETDFRIGIQLSQLMYDEDINELERLDLICELLLDKGTNISQEDLNALLAWYMNGWAYDNYTDSKENKRFVDYDIDQWRIYADFMQHYNIDLNSIKYLHWWAFCGMLWNLPHYTSSFLNVIEIRTKKIDAKTSREERKAIKKAQSIYSLKQPKFNDFTDEQIEKMDEFDRIRNGT